jgi:predicted RNase H-like HicB family nuclease
MRKSAAIYSALPYAVEVVPDLTTDGEQVYVARHPELPGCMAHGATPDEARVNLREARELFIETMLEDGLEPPVPSQAQQGISGTFAAVLVSFGTNEATTRPSVTSMPSATPLATVGG